MILAIGNIFKNNKKLKRDRSHISKDVSVHKCFISSQVDLISQRTSRCAQANNNMYTKSPSYTTLYFVISFFSQPHKERLHTIIIYSGKKNILIL